MTANTTVSIWLHEKPEIEGGSTGVTLRLDEVTTLLIGGDRPADLLRGIATELLVMADLIDHEGATIRRHLADAAELVAEHRRANGEIAPDGICWECHVDDHSKHRDFNEGRCYGCGCSTVGTKGDDR